MRKFFTHSFPFPVLTEEHADKASGYVKLKIRYAEATAYLHGEHFTITQRFNFPNTYLEFLDSFSNRPYRQQLIVHEPWPILVLIFRGKTGIGSPAHHGAIILRSGNCLAMASVGGQYTLCLPAGHVRILFLAFRPAWFNQVAKYLEEIRPVLNRPSVSGTKRESFNIAPLNFAICRYAAKLTRLEPSEDPNTFMSEAGILITQILEEYNSICIREKAFNARLNKITSHIRNLINEGKPLPSIAKIGSHFGFSLRNLQYYIKEATGNTPTEYINQLKMEEAARLLTQTSLQIQEIAEILGYQTLAGFRKQFKKKYRRTPGSFRNQNPRKDTKTNRRNLFNFAL